MNLISYIIVMDISRVLLFEKSVIVNNCYA
jgi:hypothetical protein